MKQQVEKDRKQYLSVIDAAQKSNAAKRRNASERGPSKKKQKSGQPADPPQDRAELKKAFLYFSVASKLAALTTAELEQFLVSIEKPV